MKMLYLLYLLYLLDMCLSTPRSLQAKLIANVQLWFESGAGGNTRSYIQVCPCLPSPILAVPAVPVLVAPAPVVEGAVVDNSTRFFIQTCVCL